MSFFSSCYFKSPWTNEERQKFEKECLSTTTVDNLSLKFKGFDDVDFDSILVKEFKENIIIDSFKVSIRKSGTPDDKKNKIRYTSINRVFNLTHLYKFIISGQEPYELTNIKMAVTAEFTMQGEGHGCRLNEYVINGKKAEQEQTIIIEKSSRLN